MSAVFSSWPTRVSLPGRFRNLGKSVMEDPVRRARAFCCAVPKSGTDDVFPRWEASRHQKRGLSCLAFEDQKALQIVGLREFERHRMVRSGAVALDDLRAHAGVERGAGDDRLEE